MKKITLLLLTACNLFLFSQTNRTTDVTPPKIDTKPVTFKYPTKAFVSLNDYYQEFNAQNLIAPKLYGQTPFITENISSQQFDAANTQYTSNAADDFKVPANKVWNINSVFANGQTSGTTYPTSYNVTFYQNTASNLPGAVIRTENIVLAAGSESPTLPLATTLVLPEGTYWISVQAVLDLSGGQWYWRTYNDASTLNAPFAWINPGNGFATTCNTAWKTASTCLPAQLKDLIFTLDGTQTDPCRTIIGRINITDPTQTNRINRDGVVSACGTPKTFPGITGSGNYHYKTYSFQNTSASAACVTITINNADTNASNQTHLVAYNGSFNPANLSQNYMGDIGSSSSLSNPKSMGITVAANSTVILITSEVTLNTVFTADYTINISSPNCATILKTIENPKNAVSVYPNPTTGVLFINGMKPVEAKVIDVSGKLIPTKVSNNTIDTQKLPKGNYILNVADKNGNSATTKFIKK